MARPQSISDEQILEAARKIFLEKGYSGSTAEIARCAGVSEGTIFRRYPSKDALFIASLGLDRPPPMMGRLLELATSDAPFEARLRILATEMLGFYRDLVPRITCAKSSPIDLLSILKRNQSVPMPVLAMQAMEGFFQAAIDRGEIASVNPRVPCRILMGTLHGFVFFEVAGVNEYVPLDGSELVDGVVNSLVAFLRVAE